MIHIGHSISSETNYQIYSTFNESAADLDIAENVTRCEMTNDKANEYHNRQEETAGKNKGK